jgi:hypothetical protein
MSADVEEWRPVVGCEGRYEVSDHGRVRSIDRTIVRRSGQVRRRGQVLARRFNSTPYPYAQLGRSGGNRAVHLLVLLAFVGPRPEGMQCRHLDGNGANCHLSNLAWGTVAENTADKLAHGTVVRGEAVGNSKLTEADVVEIRRSSESNRVVALRYGVAPSLVSMVRTGRVWAHVPGARPRGALTAAVRRGATSAELAPLRDDLIVQAEQAARAALLEAK